MAQKILMLLVLLAVLSAGCTGLTLPPPYEIGQPLPELTFTNLEGTQVPMSDFRGRTVLLNYWRLGCKPCLEEFPTFEKLAREYKEQGLEIVAVHLGGPTEDVAQFVKEHGYSFTVLLDLETKGTSVVPTTYVVDRDGIVRHHWLGGPLHRDDILPQLQPYLAE
ncbi:MAG: TlpA family protein disulfide reductase [Anaerolineae bacterium]|nr:TlpA family protein disulfide reductase [Anaerolineae bacterium]